MKVSIRAGDPANPLDAALADCKELGRDWYWCFEVPWEQARGAIADRRHIVRDA
jgi:hypothetical protein